jgi:hypothetical protein
VLILQALNEGLGVNAVCRSFHVGKNSLYRWQERLSDLKPTLLLYPLCHQFLNLVVEGDELYTKVKNCPPRMLKGGPSYCWSGLLALSGNCGVDTLKTRAHTPISAAASGRNIRPLAGSIRKPLQRLRTPRFTPIIWRPLMPPCAFFYALVIA